MEVERDYTCDICGESFDTNVKVAGHMRAHQVSIPGETIVDELQRLADEKGRPPTHSEINNETEFTEGAVRPTFGGWNEGLEAAGLEPQTNGYCDTEIIEFQVGHPLLQGWVGDSVHDWTHLAGSRTCVITSRSTPWPSEAHIVHTKTAKCVGSQCTHHEHR